MAAIRRTDTRQEILLRSALHAEGLRFRKDFPIRVERRLVRPDIVFTRFRLAVFLDGCFWHSCPAHGQPPKTNNEYWIPKLERNAERDREQTRLLQQAGWSVVRIWEHVSLGEAVLEVARALCAARNLQGD